MPESIVATIKSDDVPLQQDRVSPTDSHIMDEIKTTPREFELLNRRPFLSEVYKLDWDNMNDQTDAFKLKTKTESINNWIMSDLIRKNLKDELNSYKALLNDLEYKSDCYPTEKVDSKIKKLYHYIKNYSKMKEINKRLKGDSI